MLTHTTYCNAFCDVYCIPGGIPTKLSPGIASPPRIHTEAPHPRIHPPHPHPNLTLISSISQPPRRCRFLLAQLAWASLLHMQVTLIHHPFTYRCQWLSALLV